MKTIASTKAMLKTLLNSFFINTSVLFGGDYITIPMVTTFVYIINYIYIQLQLFFHRILIVFYNISITIFEVFPKSESLLLIFHYL